MGQRTVVVFSHDTLPFQYGDHPTVNRLKIEGVPDSTVNIVMDINGRQQVVKTLPYGQKTLVYELRPGNRGQMGMWYRGDQSRPVDLTVSFEKIDRLLVADVENEDEHTYDEQDTVLQPDFVALTPPSQTIDSDIENITVRAEDTLLPIVNQDTSTAETRMEVETHADTLPSKTDKQLAEEAVDIWTAVKEASFEFDRVRLLRNYFVEQGCSKDDVFRALKHLRYDPSRLELCRYLVDICKSELKEWQADIAETFFVYPHFRKEFNDML